MNILCTGGAGYIGSVLVSLLLREGHNVTVLDNFRTGYRTSLLPVISNNNLSVIEGDARDYKVLNDVLKNQDFILPLAAVVGAPACAKDPITAETTNLESLQRLLKALYNHQQKIIWPCSNSGYGVGEKGIACTEETPMRPVSLYGELKVKAENVLLRYENTISLRLATVFGVSPSVRWDLLVNDFVYRAVHDRYVLLYEPHFIRNYIHVFDVARAFLHAIEHFDSMKGQAYNVGLSNANLSKLELCEEIKKQVPNFDFVESAFGNDPDKRNYIVSNAKIEALDFHPVVSLQEGITELIKASKLVIRERRDY